MAIGTIPYNGGDAGEWNGTPGGGAVPDNAGWPASFAQEPVFGMGNAASPSPGLRTDHAISSLLPPTLENSNG